MITLQEHIEISEKVLMFEGEAPAFTEEQLEAAEFYQLKWNAVSGDTELYLYDVNGEGLGSVSFEDADIAIAFVEEYFDLDEDDILDLESYAWADDDPVQTRIEKDIIGDV